MATLRSRVPLGTVPDPLTPIVDALASVRTRQGTARVAGLAPELLVDAPDGWFPATRCADGSALPELLDAAKRHWSTTAHVAAALLWKQYTYWLLLPAVLGYALGRVPLLSAENVLVQPQEGPAFVRLGLAQARVAPDLKTGLLDAHLDPMLGHLR